MTDQDHSIDKWIEFTLSANSASLTEFSSEQSFEVICESNREAMRINRRFEALGLDKTHALRIVRGDGYLFSPGLILNNRRHSLAIRKTPMPTTDLTGMLGSIRQSPELTKYLRRSLDIVRGTMFIYRANDEMTLEGCIPDITEARLNKPISEMLGKPISVLNKTMADRRRPAIESVLAKGESATKTYDYIWAQRKWDFIEAYQYFPATDGGIGHVIITVMDPDTPDGWEQRGHFHNMIKNGLAVPTPKIIL